MTNFRLRTLVPTQMVEVRRHDLILENDKRSCGLWISGFELWVKFPIVAYNDPGDQQTVDC